MDSKLILSIVATGITIGCFIPYIRSILRGDTHPHVFSWVIWGLTTIVAFAAQLAGGGGWGAWPIGVSGCITIGVAVMAYQRRGDISITPLDVFFFVTALLALPFWYFTDDPLWAIILLSFADSVGTWPTLRKCWDNPYKEELTMYVLLLFRNLISIAALQSLSWTTVLFPGTMAATIVVLLVFVLWRRQVLSAQ